ncbi:hypothetical protein H0H93_006686 [Arthromyces matolae]|nr:hypothetical protein H0H93_006686 [Arthromyces matolae]
MVATAFLAVITSASIGVFATPTSEVVPAKWISVEHGVTEAGNTTLAKRVGTEVVTCYNTGTKADRAPIISVIDDWCK